MSADKAIQANQMEKPFLKVLSGERQSTPPMWFMRQAGRYLPEYRKLRAQKGGFLEMAFDPSAACEVTVQPIRRFKMDAAIVFSDILTIPHALGQHLEFAKGEGPKLDAIRDQAEFEKLSFENFDHAMKPVYDALSLTRKTLDDEGFQSTALIGFAGAPWTVATYMVEGGGSKDFAVTKAAAYDADSYFPALIDLITEATTKYLAAQIEAGAEVLQIFDSWSGALTPQQFDRWSIEPTAKIVQELKKQYPDVKIIGFPKGAAFNYERYVRETGIDAVGLDYTLDTRWVAKTLQPLVPVQGNLDPMLLLAGGQQLDEAVIQILRDLSDGPFVFNLGHGINKNTPISHVERVVELVRGF